MPANQTNRESGETAVSTLLIDFELFPNLCYTWGMFEQNVIQIVRPRMICSVAWKWLGDSKAYVKALPDFSEYRRDKFSNLELMRHIRDLVNQASIVVGHNVDAFDLKRGNTDMIKGNLQPPAPYRTIDTLKIARQKFGFNSNRLGDLCDFLGVPGKVKHEGFALWGKCMAGDMKAWGRMKRYNKGDVDPCLEGVYRKLIPWYRPRWLTRIQEGKRPG